jgi:hypothetical protein
LNATNAYSFNKRCIKKDFIALRLHNIISCIAMQNASPGNAYTSMHAKPKAAGEEGIKCQQRCVAKL